MTILEGLRFALSRIDKSTRWNLALACVFLTGSSLLELLGLGLVFPIVHLVGAESMDSQHPFVREVAAALSITDPRTLAIVGMSGFVFLLALKALSTIFSKHWSNAMINRGRCLATQRLYAAYLRAPLELHESTHSSTIVFNLNAHCNKVFFGMLQCVVQSVSDLVLAIGMTATLFYVSPIGATASLLLGLFGLMINNWVLAKPVHEASKAQEDLGAETHKLLLESIRGIREVRIKACESRFFKNFKDVMGRVADKQNKLIVLGLIPSYFFEVLCGLFILAIIIILSANLERELILPTFALYSVTALRLLPTAGRIASQINTIRGTIPSVIIVRDEIARLGPAFLDTDREWPARSPENPPVAFKHSIELDNVSFTYQSGPQVLSDANMHVAKGELIGIVGESGAGKSTIAGLILGFYLPTSGTIKFDGKVIDPHLSAYHRSIGFVPQDVFVADDSITANVAFGAEPGDIDPVRVRAALADAQLLEFSESLPEGLNTMLGEQGIRMSGGQKQRLGIARALYEEPEILFLDEATSALDLKTESEITEVVSSLRGKKTIIIIAHRLSTVRQCDRIYFLKHGSVAAEGTFEDLQRQNPEFESLVQLGMLRPPVPSSA